MAARNKGGIAERYATALFELADEKGELDKVAEDLRALRKMLGESVDLRRMCASPVIGHDAQARAIGALAQRSGLSPLTGNFLGVLARNGRLFALDATARAFLALLATKRGEITARVASATPLVEAQLSSLTAALKRALGSAVTIEPLVDPGLLGGMIVQIGSRMVDGSIRTKLQRLSLAMKGTG